MLDNQVIDPFSGVQEDLALTFDGPYERIYKRQQQTRDPLALPASARDEAPSGDMRASLLSGLAAVLVTVALFLGAIAAVAAPSPALAVSPHMLFL